MPEPPLRSARELPRALPAARGLASAPRHCAVLRLAVPRRARGCDAQGGPLEALARAVEMTRAHERDAALAELESCREFPAALLRTLRADLLRPCADTLAVAYLQAAEGPVDAEIGDALLALAFSARFERAPQEPKPFVGEGNASEVARYQAEQVLPWKMRELEKVAELERASASVGSSGYAGTLVVLAAERAVHRVWKMARAAPVPDQVKKNYESRVRYYGALELTLADVRERWAALAEQAVEMISAQGLHRSPEADARFDALYGGRDDGYFGPLLFDPPEALAPATPAERIVSRVPSVYAEVLFGSAALAEPRLLRALVESGLSPRQRHELSRRQLSDEEAETLAYFRATLAQRTRSARHWDEAIALLEPLSRRSPRAELVLLTARAARAAPRDHRAANAEPGTSFDVRPLEQLAASLLPARIRAFALNNAARLRLLARTPETDLAASTMLEDARKLAPDGATRSCIRPLQSMGPWLPREPPSACDLPPLP